MGIVVQKVAELLNCTKGGVLILSGLPGSGKSKLANELSEQHANTRVISSDDYFMRNGKYEFDPRKLGEAHDRCWESFLRECDRWDSWRLSDGLLIVDNTNTSPFELAPYVRYATGCGIPTLTLFVSRSFEWCARDQTHGVSIETMQRMDQNITRTLKDFPRYWDRKIWSWS
jgi:predicted kinase